MPDFEYTARSKDGTTEKNAVWALNEKALAESLRARGLLPTSITPHSKHLSMEDISNMLSRIKLIDKIAFIKNLSVMMKSGLPVSRSLKVLIDQTPNKKFAKIVADISRQVESGTGFADALNKHPETFSPIFVSMVRSGELSGNLDESLKYLSEQLQKDYDLMSKARGAMTYPIVVLVVLALVGFVMFTFILPKLTATFKDFDVQLPITTKIVIAIVDVFASYGIFIFIGGVLATLGFLYWRKTAPGRVVVHKAVLYLPVFGNIVKKINIARFIRVFATLLKSGMPIVEALDVSSHVVGNIYYQKVITAAAAKVRTGSALSAGFVKETSLFPTLVVQMMQVGEESGTTDEVLAQVADFYDAEVDQTMRNLSSILEPVIMVVIGIVVGILAVSIISPIYQITQNVG